MYNFFVLFDTFESGSVIEPFHNPNISTQRNNRVTIHLEVEFLLQNRIEENYHVHCVFLHLSFHFRFDF